MYLDTDAVLARLKVKDWLKSFVSPDALENPVTSTSTVIEIQYVMENNWNRERLGQVSSEIEDEGIELVPLTTKDIKKAGELRKKYGALGVFDYSISARLRHATSR